jgi:uncharacterized protein YcbX
MMHTIESGATDVVTGLHIFPVKSCQAATINSEQPTALTVGPSGFEYEEVSDRGWVIYDEKDALYVSQRGWDAQKGRKHPNDKVLATVAVDIQAGRLALSVPNFGELSVPFRSAETEQKRTVTIFNSNLNVTDEGDEAASFYTDLLNRPVRLGKAVPNQPRLAPEHFQRAGASNQSAAADRHSYSLASQASLNALHDEANLPRGTWPLGQYRSNIDIDGNTIGPFGEDLVRVASIGSALMSFVEPLSRCVMTTINQVTGDDSQRRVSTKLARPRSGSSIYDTFAGGPRPLFAQGLSPILDPAQTDQKPTIKIGSKLKVVRHGESSVIPKKIIA